MKTIETIKIQNAYECLKYVRTAPGKVYEYELYQFLHLDGVVNKNINVAKMINDLFNLEFAICDIVESSHVSEGLNVIYTNPEYRLVLDLLLYSETDYSLDKTVYMDNIVEEVVGDKATILVYYHEVKKQLDCLLRKHPGHFYIAQAMEVFKSWPKMLELDVVYGNDVLKYFNGECLDLSNKFIIDMDVEKLKTNSENSVILKNLNAEGSFFVGKRINFDGLVFDGGVSFKGCIFKGETLSFQNSTFILNYSDYKGHKINEVTFRNSKMFVSNLLFDEITIEGNIENKIFSLEDAVIEAKYISFSKIDITNTLLFCYQTIMPFADIYMVESKIGQGKLDFEDSTVKDIIMLNVPAIPEMEFGFRSCERLIIENCNIIDNIFLNNMKVLSLRACRNQGKILTDWVGKTKDQHKNKNYPILLAIINNSDTDLIKAEQFILLKENFLNLGQYDYEDEAFIQYMNYKFKKSSVRYIYNILRGIGKYGISPGRVLITMLWTVVIFAMFNLLFSYIIPDAYSYNAFDIGIIKSIGNAFYLSVSNLVSYDSNVVPNSYITIVFSITESIIGWFLLGYLSVAVVRKTLR